MMIILTEKWSLNAPKPEMAEPIGTDKAYCSEMLYMQSETHYSLLRNSIMVTVIVMKHCYLKYQSLTCQSQKWLNPLAWIDVY